MLSLALLFVFAVSLNAKLAPLHEDFSRKPGDLIPGSYIVVFKDDIDQEVVEKQLLKATMTMGKTSFACVRLFVSSFAFAFAFALLLLCFCISTRFFCQFRRLLTLSRPPHLPHGAEWLCGQTQPGAAAALETEPIRRVCIRESISSREFYLMMYCIVLR
jgi:hypothetical protein